MTDAERIAVLEQANANLEARLAREQARSKARLTLKVTEKRGVSLYGLGRFPVSLYAEQWQRVAEHMPMILAFIADNRVSLSFKHAETQEGAADGAA